MLNPQTNPDLEDRDLPAHLAAVGRAADADMEWQELGLRAGLEIHQQLLTDRKLFCRCPAGLYTDEHDAEVFRHMRPTLSELGQYDGTALMEFRTRKDILYLLNRESVCTYEMDDTPPFLVNQQALDIALEIALLLDCSIVGELHVMRKQYLDGSIPTGFQRTAIIGVNGTIPFRGRELTIRQLALEEDACREVSDNGHTITFTTDRLSMPLVEVVTGPELRTPSEVAEAAEVIGRLLRSTGKVRRGAGATRQDVNVSISGGTRVEIKGVPSVKLIAPLVRKEALRQHGLLKARQALWSKELKPFGSGRRDYVDHVVKKSSSRVIQRALKRGDRIGAIRVEKCGGILSTPLVGRRTLAEEIAGRVRVVACLDDPPHLLHRGMDGPDALSNREWRSIRKRLRAHADDAVVVVWGPRRDIETAFEEIEIRLLEASLGIPPETRQVLNEGITDFERVLPGPDRMYPDTDLPPVAIEDHRVEAARKNLPQPPRQREKRYLETGISRQHAYPLALSGYAPVFEQAVKIGCDPKLAARVLMEELVAMSRAGWEIDRIGRDELLGVFDALRGERLFREGVPAVLVELARREADGRKQDPIDVASLLSEMGMTVLDREAVVSRVAEILRSCPPPATTLPQARLRYYMGEVMKSLRGRAKGRLVAEIVAASLDRS